MNDTLRVGVAQMNAWAPVAENLATIRRVTTEMVADGARLVCFPENATLLAPDTQRIAHAEPLDGPQVSELRELAASANAWLLIGSVAEPSDDPARTYNTSVLLSPSGEISAVYRKMHLFDVEVAPDTMFRESDSVCPGPAEPVLADVDGWSLGMTICYDLRFPELYRALADGGADIMAVPAAFTFRTGAAHWSTLLRARAIENTAYVVAPAQVGNHYGPRESYGHAMVVDPWGTVVAEVGGGPGWVTSTLSKREIARVRAAIPSLKHRRIR